jgi:pimeloyl-ACP methyl ester carboxylesterase
MIFKLLYSSKYETFLLSFGRINMGYYVKTKDNVNIYLEDLNPGCKKAILFIHGWPGNHKLFEYQFNKLPLLGYRCIGIDTRGFGNSDKPVYGYDYDTLSDDVRGVVEALDLHDFTLAGHSTGGAIAVRYMGRHNGYGVSRLALFAAAAPSLIKRPDFPYGLDVETVSQLIEGLITTVLKCLRISEIYSSFSILLKHSLIGSSNWDYRRQDGLLQL